MSLKFSSPMPHSKPSRTSEASSLKRRRETMLPFHDTTLSRIKRAGAVGRNISLVNMQPITAPILGKADMAEGLRPAENGDVVGCIVMDCLVTGKALHR